MTTRRLSRTQRWSAFALLAIIPLAITGLVTGVLGGAADRTDQIPALIVNQDEMVTTTKPDGTTSPILAGRLIVTALTGADSPGFKWTLANADTAATELQAGTAYAVITIPKDFSASIASLSTANPEQANITLTTDDAHSYLAGSLAQALGTAMTSTLGQGITKQYLSGLFAQLGNAGSSLSTAATGAQDLANGVAQLHDGLVTFSTGLGKTATGAANAASGAKSYVDGVASYTNGVDSLSSNLSALSAQAGGLNALIQACIDNGLTVAACADPQSGTSLQAAVSSTTGGLSQLSSGASQLSAGSEQLRSSGTAVTNGLNSLSSGLKQLSTASTQSADGAGQLATGTQNLATGLGQSGGQLSGAAGNPDATAAVVSEPVTLSKIIEHPLESLRDLLAMLILPAALWLGALALFVARSPFADEALQSTRGSFRIVAASLGRFLVFGVIQVALALVAAAAVGIAPLALLTGGLLAVVASFAFIGIHLLLKLLWPRASNLISMVLLIAQVVALPGVLPAEALPTWIQPVTTVFPLNWAMSGMQAIVSGTNSAVAIRAAIALFMVGVIAAVLTTLILSRRRVRAGYGFVVASAA